MGKERGERIEGGRKLSVFEFWEVGSNNFDGAAPTTAATAGDIVVLVEDMK